MDKEELMGMPSIEPKLYYDSRNCFSYIMHQIGGVEYPLFFSNTMRSIISHLML